MNSVEIPTAVLASIETLDELQDWLTTQHADIMAELHEARQEDLAGKFTAWEPNRSEVYRDFSFHQVAPSWRFFCGSAWRAWRDR